MSYQVLARKWRPKNFQQLIGQEHVVAVLVNALTQQRLHHAYLFTGTRGVGKTTIARIFAKSLNCQQGITATPCGECDVCQDIDDGRFIDLIEVDAASKTKVDDTREILDNVQYAPSRGRYKVYLIDEVHMLSRSSFNALLKTLEEPPEHVKFILATTDPQKLPITVLSRCLQFHLKALTRVQIETKLAEILAAEQVPVEQQSLTLLAKAGRGSMRDALSLTDQAIAQGQGSISADKVQQMLGGVDTHWPYKVLIHIIKHDSQGLMQLSLAIAAYAPNYGRLLAELLQLLHQIALYQITQQHFDMAAEQIQLLEKFAKALAPDDVQLYYQIVLNGRKDLAYAADDQAGFEMILLRMLAFKPMHHAVSTTPQQNSEPAVLHNDLDVQQLPATSAPVISELTTQTISSLTTESAVIKEPNTDSQSAHEAAAVAHLAMEDEIEQQLNNELFQIEQQATELGAPSSVQDENLTTLQDPPKTIAHASITDVKTELTGSPDVHQNENVTPVEQVLDPIAAAISTRNMLRSRKKKLGSSAKKLSDAQPRQSANQPTESQPTAEQNLSTTTAPLVIDSRSDTNELNFNAKLINPVEHKYASQVDRWAQMIEAMALGGRLKQLALHATIDEQSEQNIIWLSLDQINKHLLNDNAQQQLQQKISQYLQQDIQLAIRLVEQTQAAPHEIQSYIDEQRQTYANELIEQDETVQALQQRFQARIVPNSIKAL